MQAEEDKRPAQLRALPQVQRVLEAADTLIGEFGRPAVAGAIRAAIDDLRAEIQKAIDDGNKAVSKAESVRKFVILAEDWTEEGGQMTPSLKLKRNVVVKESEQEIADLYAGAKK